jgi:decaprenylphospho-beta-D-ribofuranose 2-oxidase
VGLTGFITRAIVQLKRVETSLVKVDTVRTADIDETMATLAEHDRKHGYTVAWSNSLARGKHLGRSIITSGDFAALSDLPADRRTTPFAFDPRARLGAPRAFPPGLINRYTVRFANEAWYRKAPRLQEGELQTIGQFFHPLDGIRNWNPVYGPGGFRQYQYVMPFGAEAAVRRWFEMVSAHPAPSFVTVLKRFGEADPWLLSFPAPGWTLALDFPARTPGPRPAARRARPACRAPWRPGLPGEGLTRPGARPRGDVPAPPGVPQAPRRARPGRRARLRSGCIRGLAAVQRGQAGASTGRPSACAESRSRLS